MAQLEHFGRQRTQCFPEAWIQCGRFFGTQKIDCLEKHHRRSLRLPGYDYSRKGAYFITICTQNRECLLGAIVDGTMRLNNAGRIVSEQWVKTTEIRNEIALDAWVVMPNHFHAIVVIIHDQGGSAHCRGDRPVAPTGPQPRSVGAVMAGFKSAVTKRINTLRGTPGAGLWQGGYYEHIIRSEEELNRIRQYIADNPARWDMDRNNPNAAFATAGFKKNNNGAAYP